MKSSYSEPVTLAPHLCCDNSTDNRVDIRYNAEQKTFQYCFQSVEWNQFTVINSALALARQTDFSGNDPEVLVEICLHFLYHSCVEDGN